MLNVELRPSDPPLALILIIKIVYVMKEINRLLMLASRLAIIALTTLILSCGIFESEEDETEEDEAINQTNEISSISDSDGSSNQVVENAKEGSTVGITAYASDDDSDDTVTYSLNNDADKRFTIDRDSGVVTVAADASIDYETATSHNIEVKATSSDGTTSTKAFGIEVLDEDESTDDGDGDDNGDATNSIGAISDIDNSSNKVDENASVGTAVGITAYADDAGDSVSYTLSDSAGNKFAIHETSGVVTVNAKLNYESAASHSITVQATSSDGSFMRKSFGIEVIDDPNESNDGTSNDVSAVTDTNTSDDEVEENAANGSLVGITAYASDADEGEGVSYSLLRDADGRFGIDTTSGVVSVADGSKLNYERERAHTIEVLATSDDTSTSSAEFVISVIDVADESATDQHDVTAPEDADSSDNQVDESASIGTTVGITAYATDADDGDGVRYSLARSANGRFKIDGTSGVVTTAKALDYEADPSHYITVNANSDDGSVASTEFNIAVKDAAEISTTISGVAVDGYLQGANVCLDKDGDQKCTAADSAVVTTTADGGYSLVVDAGDAELYPVLVQVIGGTTIDSDDPNGEPVAKDSIMNAPAGKYSLVSPLTTLVQGKIADNSGLDADAAERLVIDDLGIDSDSNLSLFDDYVAEKQNTDLDSEAQADYDFVHSVAQLVAQAIADNIEKVSNDLNESTTVDADGEDFNEVVQIVVTEVADDLSEVAEAVDDAIEQTEGDEEVNLTAVYEDIDDELAVDANASKLEEEIALLEHEAEAQSGTSVADFMAAGFHWIDSSDHYNGSDNICYEYDYSDIVISWDNSYSLRYDYDKDSNGGEFIYRDDSDDRPSYLLVNDQWLYQPERPLELLAEYDDGSIDLAVSRGEEKIGGETLDVSGEYLLSFVVDDGWAEVIESYDPTVIFSAGAEILSIYEENLFDSYWIDAESDCHYDINATATCSLLVENDSSEYAKALSDLLDENISFRSGSLGNYDLQFEGELNASDVYSSTGLVHFYADEENASLVATAEWYIVNLADEASLKFKVPLALLNDDDGSDAPYYLITPLDGALHYVEHRPAGFVIEDAGTFFNRVAMDDILSAFNSSNQASAIACSLDHDDDDSNNDGGDSGNGDSSDVVISSEDGYKQNALISPNGGEEWFWYSQATVEWYTSEFGNEVDLYVIADDNSDIFDSSASDADIVNSIVNSNLNSIGIAIANTGSYTFSAEIANASGNGYAVLIVDSENNSIFDVSNAGFAITYQDDPDGDGDENDTSGNSYQDWSVNDILGKTLYLVYEDLDYYLDSDQWESSGNVINTIQFAGDYISDQSSNMHGAPYQGLFGYAEGATDNVGDLSLTWWIDGNGILHLAEDAEGHDTTEMAKISANSDYYEIQAIQDDDGSVFDDWVMSSAYEYLYFDKSQAEAACVSNDLGCSDSGAANGPDLTAMYESWTEAELADKGFYVVSAWDQEDGQFSFYGFYLEFNDTHMIIHEELDPNSGINDTNDWSISSIDSILDADSQGNSYVLAKVSTLSDGTIEVAFGDDRDDLQGYYQYYDMFFPTEAAATAYCIEAQGVNCLVDDGDDGDDNNGGSDNGNDSDGSSGGNSYQSWNVNDIAGETLYLVYEDLDYYSDSGEWESSGNVINTIQFADEYSSDQSSNMHGAPYQGLFGYAEGATDNVGDLSLTWWIDGNGILHLAEDAEGHDTTEMAKISANSDYYEIQAIQDDDGSVFDDWVMSSAYEYLYFDKSQAEAVCASSTLGCSDSGDTNGPDLTDIYQPWSETELVDKGFYVVSPEHQDDGQISFYGFYLEFNATHITLYKSFDANGEINDIDDWSIAEADGILDVNSEDPYVLAKVSTLSDGTIQVVYGDDRDDLQDNIDGYEMFFTSEEAATNYCLKEQNSNCLIHDDDSDSDGGDSGDDGGSSNDYDDWHPDDFKDLTIYLVYTDYDYVNGEWQDVGNVISTVVFENNYSYTDDYGGGYVGIYSIADGAVDSVDSGNSISGEWKIHGSGILELDDLPGDDLYIGKLQEEGRVQMVAGNHDDIFNETESEEEYFLTDKDEAERLCGDPCYDSLDEAGASLSTIYEPWTEAELGGKKFYVVLRQDDEDLPYGYYQYYAEFNTTHLLWSYGFTGGEVEHVATWELSDDGIIDLVDVDDGGAFVLGKIATLQAANTGTSDEINMRFASTRDQLQNEFASYDYFFTDLDAAKGYCSQKEGGDCLIELDLSSVYMPWQESEVSGVTWYNVYSDTDSDTGVTTWYAATYVFSADGTVTSYSGINAADGTSPNEGDVLDWELDHDDLFLELSGYDYDGTEWHYYENLIGKYDTIDGGYKTNWGSEESDMYYFPTDYEDLMYNDRSKALAKCESVGGCENDD